MPDTYTSVFNSQPTLPNPTPPSSGGDDYTSVFEAKPKGNPLKTLGGMAVGGLQWAASSPVARGLDAVLNATSRVGTATLAGENPAKAILDPARATEYTHGAETNILHNLLHIPNLPESAWQGPTGGALHVGQALLDFGVETGADPSTYVPGLNAYTIGSRLVRTMMRTARGIEGVNRALTPLDRLADRIKSGIVEGHDLRKAVQRAGENITKRHEARSHDFLRADEQRYTDLVDRYRSELDQIDARRKEIDTELNELKPLVEKLPTETQPLGTARVDAIKRYDQLSQERDGLTLPPEIEQAFMQRAYREGTPDVRRKILAAGYTPQADDARYGALNILHKTHKSYEPAQHVYTENELAATAGPVRYVGQGNRKAGFDLPQHGPNLDDPLADRVLDRLIRGARLEHYHGSRRNILTDLGLLAPSAEAKTYEALDAARTAGDTRRVQAYESLLQRQMAAQDAAAAKRALTLQPGAELSESQKLEILDPITAKERVIRQNEGLMEDITPRSRQRNTQFIEGRLQGARQILKNVQRGEAVGEHAATTAAGRAMTAQERIESDAEGLASKWGRSAYRASERLAQALPEKRPATGAMGQTISEILSRTEGESPQELGAVFERMMTRGTRGAKIATEPFARAAAAGEDVRKLARKQDYAFNSVAVPSEIAAEKLGVQTEKAQARVGKYRERVVGQTQTNEAIAELQQRASEMQDAANVINMPKELKARLFETKAIYEKGLLYEFSNLQRDALFIIPFAHQKNITILSLLGPGGPRVVAEGLAIHRELKNGGGALAAEIKELENTGATSHYIRDVEPALAQFAREHRMPQAANVFEGMLKRSNAALEHYDMAMRLALMRQLKRQGIHDPATIGGIIRDTLGDYENVAPAIRELRNRWGANFPAWRLGIVPRAMSNALERNPRAMAQYARLDRLFSDDVTYPLLGADIDVGGPVEDFARMNFPRPTLSGSNFYASTATVGPVMFLRDLNAALAKGDYGTLAADALRTVPGGYVAQQALNLPYPSSVPTALRIMAGLGGGYFSERPSIRQRLAQLKRLGLPAQVIHAMLEHEGYIGESSAPASDGDTYQSILP